jgi:hypothetical protein
MIKLGRQILATERRDLIAIARSALHAAKSARRQCFNNKEWGQVLFWDGVIHAREEMLGILKDRYEEGRRMS